MINAMTSDDQTTQSAKASAAMVFNVSCCMKWFYIFSTLMADVLSHGDREMNTYVSKIWCLLGTNPLFKPMLPLPNGGHFVWDQYVNILTQSTSISPIDVIATNLSLKQQYTWVLHYTQWAHKINFVVLYFRGWKILHIFWYTHSLCEKWVGLGVQMPETISVIGKSVQQFYQVTYRWGGEERRHPSL